MNWFPPLATMEAQALKSISRSLVSCPNGELSSGDLAGRDLQSGLCLTRQFQSMHAAVGCQHDAIGRMVRSCRTLVPWDRCVVIGKENPYLLVAPGLDLGLGTQHDQEAAGVGLGE